MYKLSKTKVKFYSSLTPEQFDQQVDQIRIKIKQVKTVIAKIRLENEYAALIELYVKLFDIKIGSLLEDNACDWKDWAESENTFYILEDFWYYQAEEFNTNTLRIITNDELDSLMNEPVDVLCFKVVTPERFQWLVNHYTEKMIMIWNSPLLKLKTNPLYKNIQWPKKLKQEKKLVDDLASIGL